MTANTSIRLVLALLAATVADLFLYAKPLTTDDQVWTELLCFLWLTFALVAFWLYRYKSIIGLFQLKDVGHYPTLIACAITIGSACKATSNVLWVAVSLFGASTHDLLANGACPAFADTMHPLLAASTRRLSSDSREAGQQRRSETLGLALRGGGRAFHHRPGRRAQCLVSISRGRLPLQSGCTILLPSPT